MRDERGVARRPALLTLAPGGDTWLRDGRPWSPPRDLYVVAGRPVHASLSPRMQQAALDAAGIAADYLALDLAPAQWPRLRAAAGRLGLRGCNVTVPYKETVVPLCTRLTPEARRLGAVNTVRVGEDGAWEGHNTDLGGVADVVARLWQGEPGEALVCGAGGAARAAVAALVDAGWQVTVAARTGPSRRRLERWLAAGTAVPDGSVRVRDWRTGAAAAPHLVVVAVAGGVDAAPAVGRPRPETVWLDLRYGASLVPPPAEVVTWRDGRALLVAQGERSFRWWHGRPAPAGVMAAAVG